MNILEKEIEDLIWDALQYDSHELKRRGFPVMEGYRYFRQFNLGSYGIIDIAAVKIFNTSINVVIYELKRDKVDVYTFLQAVRYAKGIKRLLHNKTGRRWINFDFVLVGKCIDKSCDFCYLPDLMYNVELYEFSLNLLNGVHFEKKCNYSLIEEKFPALDFTISDLKSMMYGNI